MSKLDWVLVLNAWTALMLTLVAICELLERRRSLHSKWRRAARKAGRKDGLYAGVDDGRRGE